MKQTLKEDLFNKLDELSISLADFCREVGISYDRAKNWKGKVASPKAADAEIIRRWLAGKVEESTHKEATVPMSRYVDMLEKTVNLNLGSIQQSQRVLLDTMVMNHDTLLTLLNSIKTDTQSLKGRQK